MERDPNELVDIVTIKYTPKGREYTYLVDEPAKRGEYVYVPDKDKQYLVLSASQVKIKDLPVEYSYMRFAVVCSREDDSLNTLLKNNTVLRKLAKPHEVLGREDIINDLIVNINKQRMRNTILVGNAGCGKTSIVESFADMVKDNYYTLYFSIGELIGGTKYRGDLEEKLTKIFSDILVFNNDHDKKIILFIDEIHMIMTTAGVNSLSLHDMLKTYITDPEMIVIGATTINEFNTSIKTDPAMLRRMMPIYVPDLPDDSVFKIVKKFTENKMDDQYIKLIIEESKKIPNTVNPDISLEIADRVMTRSRVLGEVIEKEEIDSVIKNLNKLFVV